MAHLKEAGAEVVEYDNDTLSFLDHFWNKTDFVSAEKMVGLSLNHSYFQGCFQVVSEAITGRTWFALPIRITGL